MRRAKSRSKQKIVSAKDKLKDQLRQPAKRLIREIQRATLPVKVLLGVISLFVIKSVYLLLTDDPYNAESIMGNWEAAVDPEIDIGNVGNVPEFLKGGPVLIVVPDDVRNVMDDDCPNPFTTDWDVPMTPLHSTDKGKYVIPILMGDADQQYSGLKDSMALAVHLNRTLILPPMYRSENDEARENGDVLIDPSIRLDIDQVRTYVHTIPLVNGLSVCEGKIDIGFLARPVDKSGRYNRVHEFEKATGIKISDGDKEMSIPLQPTIDQISDSNRGIVAPIDSPMWAQVYANEARCAAWILPYMSMDIASSWHQNPQGLPSMIQHELVEHSTIPRYAMTIAADFLEKHFQGSSGFMGVHWKFDSSDWIKGCDKLDKEEKRQACDILSKATHRDITGGILAYMSEKFDKKKHSVENIKNYGLYIASGEHDYAADQVADIGKRIMDQLGGKQFYYTTSYLEAWIKKRYEQCALTSQYLSEVVAVVEHHILFEAKALMFVQGDSWSSRVMNDRKLVGKFTRPGDKSLLDVLTNFIVGQPQMKMNPMTKQELKKRLAELKYP